MNENLLDVLLYLFENFSLADAEHAANIRDDLDEAGFFPDEIDDAFAWIRATDPAGQALAATPSEDAIRVYSEAEMHVLDAECRGFLAFLQQSGVLSATAREIVIDRLMALAEDAFEGAEIEQLKWVVMMVLSSTGHDQAYARMEAMIHAESPGAAH
ncbi:DUF494 domain-containing protein [Salinisphaera sp. T31B1]|uniref:DUF494 family protein n=1 Tax=Salinisphaera sp. T31B1 TaxID=727963 RepID=UPI00333E5739